MKRSFLTLCTIATAALFAAACSDSPVENAGLGNWPLFTATENFNNAGACMEDDNENLGGGGPVNCTSNDIAIAEAIVTKVNGVAYDVNVDEPIVCSGQNITLEMTAILDQTAESDREDVGIWIATDGGDALTGSCNHYNLLDGDEGTFNEDGDECAGMSEGASTSVPLGELTVPCVEDEDNPGFLLLGACLAWEVPGQDGVCSDDRYDGDPAGTANDFRAATLPSTPAKCNCDGFLIPVVIAGEIIIEKQTDPDGATGTFTFSQDVDASGNFPLDDDDTKQFTGVIPGEYTVTELDPTPGFDLTNLVCDDANSVENVGTRTATINVESGETVTCVFTNRQRARITIEKQTDPDGATGTFNFSQDVDVSGNFALDDGDTKDFQDVTPGQYTVTELDPTPDFDLTTLVCDDANSTENVGTRTATINVEAGEHVTCVFTNRQRGTVIIEKQTDPNGATGSFTFTQFIDGTGNFSLQDDQTKTFSNVVPGSYIVHELDPKPAGFDLTNIECSDAGGLTPSNIIVASRNATVNVSPGETVTCVYTNRERATVTVNKRESGTLPLTRAWEFEIRSGATTIASGTVEATGTAILATGVVDFVCSPEDANCVNVGGIAHLVPGNYQLCEVNMPAGWANSVASPPGFTPNGEIPEGGDNGNECWDITLAAGEDEVHNVDNTPPPGGDARTIGYWKNHSCLAPGNQEDALSPLLPIQLTDSWSINDCETVVSLLNKQDINNGKKKASDAAYGLAAQLAAALLNVASNAATCPVPTATIDAAQTLLHNIGFDGSGNFLNSKHALYATANGYAAILDDWNNNDCS